MAKKHRIKYPRLMLLALTIIAGGAVLYEGVKSVAFHETLASLGYVGTFLGGMFYAYGFTAAPATAVLMVLAKGQPIALAVLAGAAGALLSDVAIFLFVRSEFTDELRRLEREKIIKRIEKEEKVLFGHYYRHIFPVFAGFLIASPLPTEIGVTMMASSHSISVKKFLLIACALHGMGILAIMAAGNALL